MELDFERCYRAVDSRDARFDGWFVTAVDVDRDLLPAVLPGDHAEAGERAVPAVRGGRPAGRASGPACAAGRTPRPARRSGTSAADVVGRAMRLIADGVVDRDGVPGLAGRLGYTERHLHRMLTAEVGAGPLALARAQRAQTARILIETTDLGLAEIAFAAGFGSVRQFNDTIREIYGRAPSELRTAGRRRRPTVGTGARSRCGCRTGSRCTPTRCWTSSAPARSPGVDEVRDGDATDARPAAAARHRRPSALDPARRARRGHAAPGRRARPGPGGGPLPAAVRPRRRPGRRRRGLGRRPGAGPARRQGAGRTGARRRRRLRDRRPRRRRPADLASAGAADRPRPPARSVARRRDQTRRPARLPDRGGAARAARTRRSRCRPRGGATLRALAAAVADGALRPRRRRRPRRDRGRLAGAARHRRLDGAVRRPAGARRPGRRSCPPTSAYAAAPPPSACPTTRPWPRTPSTGRPGAPTPRSDSGGIA